MGRRLFTSQTDFLKGVVAMSGLPADDRLEICFAGRSNVGKSLINAMTGRKALLAPPKRQDVRKKLTFSRSA